MTTELSEPPPRTPHPDDPAPGLSAPPPLETPPEYGDLGLSSLLPPASEDFLDLDLGSTLASISLVTTPASRDGGRSDVGSRPSWLVVLLASYASAVTLG